MESERLKPSHIDIPAIPPDLSNGTDSDPGMASTPPTPNITFSVCDDDDDILEHPDAIFDGVCEGSNAATETDFNTEKRGSMLGIPSFHHLRRLSDSSMKQVKEKLKQISTSGATSTWFLKCANNSMMSRPTRTPSNPRPAIGQRKMSVDVGGILKQSPPKVDEPEKGFHGFFKFTGAGLGRKSVSFCTRDNVRVYSVWDDEADGEDAVKEDVEPQQDENSSKTANDDEDASRGRSLVPTFVFPGKRPTYAKDFEKNVLILESVDVTEDLCIMGNIRINMTKLRSLQSTVKNHRSSGRVSVGATYTTDGWKTKNDTRAMVVNAQAHPALSGKETRAMRFYIDCDELEAGDIVEFWLWCSDKFYPIIASAHAKASRQRSTQRSLHKFVDMSVPPLIKKYKDDNEGLTYKVSCTPKLNMWAAKAAQELKNFTPIIRFNQNYV